MGKMCYVIQCIVLVVCLTFGGVLGRVTKPAATAEPCVAANKRPGQCRLMTQCSNVAGAVRSGCLPSHSRSSAKVCCPTDESAVLFPDEEADFTRSALSAYNQPKLNSSNPADIDLRNSFISPGSVEFILPKILPKRCGEMPVNPSFRIVGGSSAPKGSWPWLARLGYYNGNSTNYLCAGVLITRQHILTAAHCVHKRTDLVFVRLGENGLSGTPHEYYIEAVTVHERFVPSARGPRNDIAIIRLVDFVVFSDDIKPVCLPVDPSVKSVNMSHTLPIVAGWGSTAYHEQPSNTLLQVQLPVVPQAKCAQSYKAFDQLKIDQSVLCAGYESGGKDACRGDSGGPLMILHQHRYYVMGLVSFGYRCGEAGYPGVYARISYYLGWIFKNLT